jgi:hypothetical protein
MFADPMLALACWIAYVRAQFPRPQQLTVIKLKVTFVRLILAVTLTWKVPVRKWGKLFSTCQMSGLISHPSRASLLWTNVWSRWTLGRCTATTDLARCI